MNKDIIEGNWKQIKGKIMQKWGNLTDSDLSRIRGTREELEGLLLEKYGIKKDKAKEEIESFIKQNNLH